jgi:hypothetical protein
LLGLLKDEAKHCFQLTLSQIGGDDTSMAKYLQEYLASFGLVRLFKWVGLLPKVIFVSAEFKLSGETSICCCFIQHFLLAAKCISDSLLLFSAKLIPSARSLVVSALTATLLDSIKSYEITD